MAIQLPRAQSQGGSIRPTTTSVDRSGNDLTDLLAIGTSLAPTIQRVRQQSAAKEAASRDDADDIVIGEMIAEQNQLDIDCMFADQDVSNVQNMAMEVARANQDGVITDKEQLVVDTFYREQAKLDILRDQNPAAYSSQKSAIQKKLKFQETLRNNPRLGARLVSARNSLAASPSKVSGAQVQKVMETEKEFESIYGASRTAADRVEFSQFKLMEKTNAEHEARNNILAKHGSLTLDGIMTGVTANLDLDITKIDTKFINDQNAGGGFAKSERVEQYVSQLRLLQKGLENRVYQEVAAQNKNGRGLIKREAVATRIKSIQDEIAARIEMYQAKDSGALVTKISDFQKKYLEINGGNAVSLARQISGVRGDNVGSLAATINLMGNQDPTVKNGFANLMGQSGMSALTQSVDTAAANLAGMMNSGIPLPKNLQAAGVYHGVLSMREGPVSDNVKTQLLEGVSTIGLEESIPAATKVLLDDSTARQLSGPLLKQTVDSLDGQVSNDIRASQRMVSYDNETDTLLVFSLTGEQKLEGDSFIPKMVDRTFEERVVTDGDLTKSLNALYELRTSGKYSSDLKSGAEFIKFWTDTYGLDKNNNNNTTETDSE